LIIFSKGHNDNTKIALEDILYNEDTPLWAYQVNKVWSWDDVTKYRLPTAAPSRVIKLILFSCDLFRLEKGRFNKVLIFLLGIDNIKNVRKCTWWSLHGTSFDNNNIVLLRFLLTVGFDNEACSYNHFFVIWTTLSHVKSNIMDP